MADIAAGRRDAWIDGQARALKALRTPVFLRFTWEFDRRYLEALLEAHDGNISAAARAAGIERMSIYKMIRRLGLDKEEDTGHRAPTADDDEATNHER